MALSTTAAPNRGTLVVAERNLVITFQFNPSELSDTHETVYSKHAVPGASHPVYQYGAGGERLISFSLYLDADIGWRNPATRAAYTKADDGDVLSLSRLLNQVRSLTYPTVRVGSGIKQIFAPTAYLNLGNLLELNPVECIIKKADPRITFYSAGLEPLKATVNMELAQVVRRRVIAGEVGFGGY